MRFFKAKTPVAPAVMRYYASWDISKFIFQSLLAHNNFFPEKCHYGDQKIPSSINLKSQQHRSTGQGACDSHEL